MRLKITKSWLERRAELDENAEVSAGHRDMEILNEEIKALRQTPGELLVLGEAFGKLIQFVRKNRKLSPDDLARTADIEIAELMNIESGALKQPEPRTVYQLANALKLPEKKMLELSGNLEVLDTEFTYQTERFAANAKNIENLTDEQRSVLMAYVKYLAQT
jgi:transcriptional regulator with XRE-family HTH domain